MRNPGRRRSPVTSVGPRGSNSEVPPRHSRRRRSSRRRAGSSGSAPSGRCPSPSDCTKGPTRRTGTSGSSPTCEPTRPPSPAWRWGRPATSSPARFGTGIRDAEGPRLQDEVQGRPGGRTSRSGRPASAGIPDMLAGSLKPEELRSLPADLAAGHRFTDGSRSRSRRRPPSSRTAPTSCGRAPPARCSMDSRASTLRAATTSRGRGGGRGPAPGPGKGDQATVAEVEPTQHFTEPPPRFTEASLVKALEEHGIGRPSTYAATLSTIVDRGYVRIEERRLRPELIGEIVTDFLVAHFGELRRCRVHRPAWRRSSTRSPGASGRGSRCSRRSTGHSGIGSRRSARSSDGRTSRPRSATRSVRSGTRW